MSTGLVPRQIPYNNVAPRAPHLSNRVKGWILNQHGEGDWGHQPIQGPGNYFPIGLMEDGGGTPLQLKSVNSVRSKGQFPDFDVTDSHRIDCGSINPINRNLQSWSLVVGISMTSGQIAAGNADGRIFTKDKGSAQSDHVLMLGMTTSESVKGFIRARVGFGGSYASSTLINDVGKITEDGQLNLAACVYNGALLRVVMIDGLGEYSATSTPKSGDLTTTSDPCRIGMTASAAENMFEGTIHFVYFFDGEILLENKLREIWNRPYSVLTPWTQYIPFDPVSGGVTVNVPAASLGLAGFAPTINVSNHQAVPIPNAILALSAFVPTINVSDHKTINVPVAAIDPAGQVPNANVTENISVDVPTASLSLTGLVPAANVTQHQVVNVPTAVLTLTGLVPIAAVSGGVTVDVPVATLTLTGLQPTANASDHKTIIVPNAALSLVGLVPIANASDHKTVNVPAGTIDPAGLAPVINTTENVVLNIPAASLTMTGFEPVAGVSVSIDIPVASLTLTGYAPNAITITIVTPDGRTFVIESENRVWPIGAENRTYAIN